MLRTASDSARGYMEKADGWTGESGRVKLMLLLPGPPT